MSESSKKPEKSKYRFTAMDWFMAFVGFLGVTLFIISAVNIASAWLELPEDERPYPARVSVEIDTDE